MKSFISFIKTAYVKDKISILSAYSSFFIVVSSIPFLTLLFYILIKYLPSFSLVLRDFISIIIPFGLRESLGELLNKIELNQGLPLLPISIITAVWSSTKGVNGVCRGIEAVFEKERKHSGPFGVIVALYRALAFFIVVIASLLVFSLSRALNYYSFKSSVARLIFHLRIVVFFSVLTVFFALLYLRLSGKGKLKNHLLGALFSSVMWTAFTYFYSLYISYALTSSGIYAGVGALVFFMLWLYFCLIIILLGAEISKYRLKNAVKP